VNSSAAGAAGRWEPAPCSPVEASQPLGAGRWVGSSRKFCSSEVWAGGLCLLQVFCCLFFYNQEKPEFPFLLCLRHLAAGFDHSQQHHTLSFNVSKGGTLVNPDLVFWPRSKFLCRSSVSLNEEQGLLQIQRFRQQRAQGAGLGVQQRDGAPSTHPGRSAFCARAGAGSSSRDGASETLTIYWSLNWVHKKIGVVIKVIKFTLLYHSEIIVLPEHRYPAIFLLPCHLLKIKAHFHYNELQIE